jgi:cytochrome c oxidase subunit 4
MATAAKYAHEEHDSHVETTPMKTYIAVFAALMSLLIVTVFVAYLPWDKWNMKGFSVVVALAIATIKALLVVLWFMHVIHATRLTKIFVIAAFLWLGIMFIFTFSDYLSRGWTPNSAGWVGPSPLHDPYPSGHLNPPEAAANNKR